MKLTAAPIIREARINMPAPAYTDMVKIVIAEELNDSEAIVAIRHEQAHIWCEHGNRYHKNMDRAVWQIACELEIARNIYTDEDIAVIERPRSKLAGGYLPDSIKELPVDVNLAEDIYDWLKNNPDKLPEKQSMCSCEIANDGGVTGEGPQKLIDASKDALEAIENQRQPQEDLSVKMKAIKYRQPSLVDEMDAILRHRVIRERSWRRPSRRENKSSLMSKGQYTVRKRPLVEVFVDRSGSFNPSKTAAAESALKKIVAKYNVQLKMDVFYFGNDKISGTDVPGGGNTPYHLIISHLRNTQPKIAVVITDDDSAGPFNESTPKQTEILCIPVGSSKTNFSSASGGRDVNL